MRLLPSLAVAAGIALAPAAQAITISQIGSFTTQEDVDGLAFDATSGNLFIVNDGSQVFEYTTAGAKLRTLDTAGESLRGLHVLNSGNLLAAQATTGSERIVELDPVTGALVAGGIDFAITVSDSNGVVYDVVTDTIIHADEDSDTLRTFDRDGTLLSSIDTGALGVRDTEGVTINPFNGNLLVADDLRGGNLFEISRDGALLDTVSLDSLSGGQDALALTVDAARGLLYIGQGNDNRVDIFRIAAPAEVPEPAGIALVLLAFATLTTSRRTR